MTTITPRAEKAINILVDAYNNDHLAAGHCRACAVGNLVADGAGAKVVRTSDRMPGFRNIKEDKPVSLPWYPAFKNDAIARIINLEHMTDPTGYTVDELKEIERVFEANTEHKYEKSETVATECLRRDSLKGLKAVVKTLLKLDNCEGADIDEIFTDKIQPIQNQPL